ncbi:MAG: hypothetical protein HQL73_02860 [Magnetococcales bacterium]|nr:hypothetical protein [Magnetococcales bacterium]
MRWQQAFVFGTCLVVQLFCPIQPPPVTTAEEIPSSQTHPAREIYKKFADALIRGRFDEARAWAEGDALEVVKFQENAVHNQSAPVTIFDSQFMIFAEKVSEDGRGLRLNAMQVVKIVEKRSAYIPPVLHRQEVDLQERNGLWKVHRFKDRLEKCCL